MLIRSAGVDLSRVIGAVCDSFKIEEKELSSPTRRPQIARARSVVGLIATGDLSITGSEVAHRLKVDRSAVSRAVQRAGKDPELIAGVSTIVRSFQARASQD